MLHKAITVLLGIYIDAVVLQLRYFPKSILLSKSKVQNVPFPNIKKTWKTALTFIKYWIYILKKKRRPSAKQNVVHKPLNRWVFKTINAYSWLYGSNLEDQKC